MPHRPTGTSRRDSWRVAGGSANAPGPGDSYGARRRSGRARVRPRVRAPSGSLAGEVSLTLGEVIAAVGRQAAVRLALAVRPDDRHVGFRVVAEPEVLFLRVRGEVADR